MDSLEENIETAREVALVSTRNHEEVARKLAMTQVEFDRTNEKCKEAEQKIDELEEQLNVVGQNMKTLELSETNALKRHEEAEEKIRDLILNLKFTEIQAAAAEREAAKLSQELELLVAELNEWKEKYGEICVELEQTFNEMAGYWICHSVGRSLGRSFVHLVSFLLYLVGTSSHTTPSFHRG